tara:strand:+ start:1352 stop:2470 length:1119 start_codon:yes stop_codon:yes gene_type:complete
MNMKYKVICLFVAGNLCACGGGGGGGGESNPQEENTNLSGSSRWDRAHDYDFTEWDNGDRFIQLGNTMYTLMFNLGIEPVLASTVNGKDFTYMPLEKTDEEARNITHLSGYDKAKDTFLFHINSVSEPGNYADLKATDDVLPYEIASVGTVLVESYGYEGSMVFTQSIDGGDTWEALSPLLITNTQQEVSSLPTRTNDIELINRNELISYSGRLYVAGRDTGVWTSEPHDFSTWTLNDVEGQSVVDITAWDEGGRIYCTTKEGKVFRSRDSGLTWEELAQPHDSDGNALSYAQGEIPIGIGQDGTLIVAGAGGDDTATTHIWVSRNDGASWSQIDDAPVTIVTDPIKFEPKLYVTQNYYWYSYDVGNYYLEK